MSIVRHIGDRAGKRVDAAHAVLEALQRGELLICEYRQSETWWSLSSGEAVAPSVATIVLTNAHVVGRGDCLFPGAVPSQCFGWQS